MSLLKQLGKENSYLVRPFSFRQRIVKSGKNSLVLFQKKYEKGSELHQASVPQLLGCFIDGALGLEKLHTQNYVHMDFKPANCLIEGDLKNPKAQLALKITDLEFTVEIQKEIIGGSPLFIPPEHKKWDGNRNSWNWIGTATPEDDSYALGMFILEILVHKVSGDSINKFTPEKEMKYSPFQLYRYQIANQSSYEEIDESLQNLLKTVANEINSKGVDTKMQIEILNVCKNLLKSDPKQRTTCQAAADQLEEIKTNFSKAKF